MNSNYVLIVDDDLGMYALLSLILKPLHLDVEYASDGYKALTMIAANRPSLIFLDLQMYKLDGFSVLERLGETAETANIPVTIFSATLDIAQRSDYEWPAQVIEVIEKPKIRPDKLRELVKRQLGF